MLTRRRFFGVLAGGLVAMRAAWEARPTLGIEDLVRPPDPFGYGEPSSLNGILKEVYGEQSIRDLVYTDNPWLKLLEGR